MSTSWLIDKSALVRLGSSPDAEEWADRIERGLVTITTVTLLEAGFSARSAVELARALGSKTGPCRCNASWPSADSIAPRRSPIC
jgi:predicted nucleic acid-binding protein